MTTDLLNRNETRDEPGLGPALVVGVALILCAFWMLVWRGSLDGAFHFDDYSNIVDNERIRQLWPLDNFIRNNRPIGLYSFAVNYHFSGTEPYAYHATNLAIHISNGLFVMTGCLLTWRLYRKHWADEIQPPWSESALLMAGLIATAWVVHPLTTQAVTNIVQRYESLASMGYLGVWVGMLLYLNGRRRLGCTMVITLAWIGLMSKEVFAGAPLAVLLLDRLVTRQPWLSIVRHRWFPYMLMVSPYVWFIPSVSKFFDTEQTRSSSMGLGMDQISPWEYLRTQAEVIWHYVGLVLWPKDLCFDYLWRIQTNPWNYLPLGAAIVMVLVGAMVCYGRGTVQFAETSTRTFATGLAGWLGLTFFLILAPTSSVMPIADIAVEHRMYLASAVVIAGIVLLLRQLSAAMFRNSDRPWVLRLAFSCIVAACISLLAWRTHLRNQDYHDGFVLWSTAARISPQNPRAWYNVGREFYSQGNYAEALRPMVSAVGLSPTSVPMFDAGLADCLRRAGRLDDAVTLFKRAIEKKSGEAAYHNDLGVTHLQLDQLDLAEQEFLVALGLRYPDAKYNLAVTYDRQGKAAASVPLLKETLAEDPSFHVAARRLAWTLATTGDTQIKDVERAERLLCKHYDLGESQKSRSLVPTSETSAQARPGSPLPASGRGAGGEGLYAQSPNAYVLDTWAAILAAQGEFEAAGKVATQALALAQSKPNESLIPEITKRLAGYQRGEPCIDGVQP